MDTALVKDYLTDLQGWIIGRLQEALKEVQRHQQHLESLVD